MMGSLKKAFAACCLLIRLPRRTAMDTLPSDKYQGCSALPSGPEYIEPMNGAAAIVGCRAKPVSWFMSAYTACRQMHVMHHLSAHGA